MNENKMAQIPYVVHEYRMDEAYKRERRLKIVLGISNFVWAFICFCLL